jgi:hypothetical protein
MTAMFIAEMFIFARGDDRVRLNPDIPIIAR